MRSSFFWYVTQRMFVVRGQSVGPFSKKGLLGCPETSVISYQSTLRNIPEERKSHYQPILSALFHSTTICMYVVFHYVQATPYHTWR